MRPVLHVIAAARPNFMKIAPIVRALRADGRLDFRLVHTGQHRDPSMNDVFFEELGIPAPDVRLAIEPGTHAQTTARVMMAYEELCLAERPAATLVVGDVNSTLACALAAKKLHIPVAHVEAGLRSGDMAMPEEVNRLATDAICDWYFASEPSAVEHLRREGKPMSRVFFAGNVMVDNLLYQAARLSRDCAYPMDDLKRGGAYGVVTLHRPSNVDDPQTLRRIAGALREVARDLRLVFPVHPRTRAKLLEHDIELGRDIRVIAPQGYMSFLSLWKDAAVVLTDSGGLQEETTALGVPCVTIRESTERPVTVEEGTNVLAGTRPEAIVAAVRAARGNGAREPRRPRLWDGRAAERIVRTIAHDLDPAPREDPIVTGAQAGVRRMTVMGCGVDDLTMEETLGVIESFIASGRPHQHVVVNVDKLVKARRDPGLRRIVNDCALVNADGMPVVWASRLLGSGLKQRVAGIDLFDALMGRAADRGWRVYLLGARREVVEAVRRAYEGRYPALVVAGARDGYWKPDQEAQVAEDIRSAQADLLFVAISSPKKERFLARWQPHMRVPFAMGVGGSFDVAAGRVRRAPEWMQHAGLEWLFRFLQEPRRMFRRYFIDDMAFFAMLAAELARRRMKATIAVLTSVALAAFACVSAVEG